MQLQLSPAAPEARPAPSRGRGAPAVSAPREYDDENDYTARLVRAAARGDLCAWDELVARHSGPLRTVARAHRLSSADAEDVVQTTWLRLVEHLPRIRTPGSLRGWLAMTARRECLRILRDAKRCAPSESLCEAELRDEAAGSEERVLRNERDEALWQAFHRLAPRDQALLGLLIEDVSYKQISMRMAIPTGSIGPTRARSLSRLRREAGRVGLVD